MSDEKKFWQKKILVKKIFWKKKRTFKKKIENFFL